MTNGSGFGIYSVTTNVLFKCCMGWYIESPLQLRIMGNHLSALLFSTLFMCGIAVVGENDV